MPKESDWRLVYLSKDLTITMLHDFYGELLTEKQSRAIDLYYNEDLSLFEIAEPLGVTRQGVRDAIKRGEKQLLELEEKLGLINKFLDICEQLSSVSELIKKTIKYEKEYVHSAKIAEALAEIDRQIEDIHKKI